MEKTPANFIEVEGPDGDIYEFPASATDDQIASFFRTQMSASQEPRRTLGQEVVRKAEYGARGFTDSAIETLGALPDLVAQGTDALGITDLGDDYYTNAMKDAWSKVGQTVSAPLNGAMPDVMSGPMTTGDKAAYGGGHMAGDATSILVPAAAVAKGSRAGSLTNKVAKDVMTQPGLQMAAAGVGGSVEGATDSPVLGLAAALATPIGYAGLRRVATPNPSTLSMEERRLAALAEANGIKLTPAQKTGSKPLSYLESTFQDLPFTSATAGAQRDAQRSAWNRMALKTAGVNADNVAPQVLDDAFRSIGREFDDLAAQTVVNIDDGFFRTIDDTAAKYARRLPTDIKPVFQSYVDDLAAMREALNAPGTQRVEILGQEYKKIASDLRSAARRAKNNPDLQGALNGLVDALDEAMERSASRPVAEAWRSVRRRYRNLLAINDAAAKGTQESRGAGYLSPSGLTTAVRSQDKAGYARGRGDLNDAARVGEFLANKTPNSGTPARQYIANLLSYGGPTGAATYGAATGDVTTSAALAAAMLTGPRTAQLLYNTPLMQKYLTNQAFTAPVVNRRNLAALLAQSAQTGPQ